MPFLLSQFKWKKLRVVCVCVCLFVVVRSLRIWLGGHRFGRHCLQRCCRRRLRLIRRWSSLSVQRELRTPFSSLLPTEEDEEMRTRTSFVVNRCFFCLCFSLYLWSTEVLRVSSLVFYPGPVLFSLLVFTLCYWNKTVSKSLQGFLHLKTINITIL